MAEGCKLKLRCACGSEAEFETPSNFYVSDMRKEMLAWQDKHAACLKRMSLSDK